MTEQNKPLSAQTRRLIEDPHVSIDRLTKPHDWGWTQYENVILALSHASPRRYVPAYNMPNSLDTSGLRPSIAQLKVLSHELRGKETGRYYFADSETQSVIPGVMYAGSDDSVRLYAEPEKGKKHVQTPVGTSHIHVVNPRGILRNFGFTGTDYLTFLSDPNQIFMVMVLGDTQFHVLKSSSTQTFSPASISGHIIEIENDVIASRQGKVPIELIVAFNKEVCVDFALCLYMNKADASDKLSRVTVVY